MHLITTLLMPIDDCLCKHNSHVIQSCRLAVHQFMSMSQHFLIIYGTLMIYSNLPLLSVLCFIDHTYSFSLYAWNSVSLTTFMEIIITQTVSHALDLTIFLRWSEPACKKIAILRQHYKKNFIIIPSDISCALLNL